MSIFDMKSIKSIFGFFLIFSLGISFSKPAKAQGSQNIPTDAFWGEYYNEPDFSDSALTRVDARINFNWGRGQPDALVEPNTFSVRWTGNFDFSEGIYEFIAKSDDGVAVYIDGQKVINGWGRHMSRTYKSQVEVLAGTHQLIVEYFEHFGQANVQVSWSHLGLIQPKATPSPETIQTNSSMILAASYTQSGCDGLGASTVYGEAPLEVEFIAVGYDPRGVIAEYEFDFGDASGGQPQVVKQTASSAIHTYFNPGVYTAKVRIKDSGGSWRGGERCVKTITVIGEPEELSEEAEVTKEDMPGQLPKTGGSLETLLLFAALYTWGVYFFKRFKVVKIDMFS